MAQSSAVTAGNTALDTDYNNLRDDVLSTTLGHLHDGTNGREPGDSQQKFRNPADTFSYTIRTSAITAARDLTIPLITANDTLVVLALAQTLTNKTLTTPTIADFTNAGHSHQNAAGGATLGHNAATDNPTVAHGATGAVVGTTNTQTLTNKTLTSPTIQTSPTAAGATWADLGTVTTVAITTVTSAGGLTLAPTGDIVFNPSGGTQTYNWSDRSAGITLQGQSVATGSFFEFYSKDGDGLTLSRSRCLVLVPPAISTRPSR